MATWQEVGKKIVGILGPASALAAPFLGPAGPLLTFGVKALALSLGLDPQTSTPDIVMAAIDKNPEAAAALAQAQMAFEHQVLMQQMADDRQSRSEQVSINLENAKDLRFWNSGWRPGIGWVCSLSLLCYYVPQSVMGTIVWVISIQQAGWKLVPYPNTFDVSELLGLVATLLGVGGLKTLEKIKGVSK